jgi:glycosyltransferase involved in cell wall biosynthesis
MPGWRRVRFLGQVPRAEVVAAMRSARAGVVLNHPTVNYVDAYPTKMFEYMACGLPVVCSNFPLWTEIVRGADCGIAVDPRDPRAIADAIRALGDDPALARRLGENGRRAIAERFNWEAELGKLEALYRKVA